MPSLINITEFLDEYLNIDDIEDTCWNGLQFQAKSEITKIAFAVDAGVDTFTRAAEVNAELVVVHHGHFWKSQNPSLSGWNKDRINILYEKDISLYACHLPLDRHPEVGHNAEIVKLLGARIVDEFLHHKGKNIGWIAKRKQAARLPEIENILTTELGAECTVLPFGKPEIKTIAVCSGGGGYGGFSEALLAGVDLYLTGDAVEIYYTAKDAGINVIFAGHHATEILGLKALAEVLSKKFQVETVFIDLPTGL